MSKQRLVMMTALFAASIAFGTMSASAVNMPKPTPTQTIEESDAFAPVMSIRHRDGERGMMRRGYRGRMMDDDRSMRRGDRGNMMMKRGYRSRMMRSDMSMRDGMSRRGMRGNRGMSSRTMPDRRVTAGGNPANAGGSPRSSQ